MQTPGINTRRCLMVVQEAIDLFKQHQKSTVRKSTLKSYGKFMDHFQSKFALSEVQTVTSKDIGKFLEECTGGLSRATRHLRYAQIKAFSIILLKRQI
jgi:hypothetical protein